MIPTHHPFQFKTSDGLTLQGMVYGEGYPEVVFTHGNGLAVPCYAPAFAPLAPLARVYGLNARGHGGSDVPPDFPSWRHSMEDVRDFIVQHLHPPVVLVAHSFGANLSLWLTAEYPALVRGMVLLDPIIPFRRFEPWPEGSHAEQLYQTALGRRGKWPSRAAAAESLKGRGGYKGWHEEAWRQFLEAGFVFNEFAEFVLACPPWLEAAIFKSRPAGITWEWAEKCHVPAVVLGGEASLVTTPECFRDLAHALPQGEFVSMPGGHAFPLEHPVETGRALYDALSRMVAQP